MSFSIMIRSFLMLLVPAFLLLVGTCSAVDIQSNSQAGQKLLAKARPLNAHGRQLDDYYTAWMTKYSMKFDGCHSVPQFEREEGIRSMLLARFKMCPSDNCDKCPNAGEYIVEMRDFVEAYSEAQMSLNEYACESQKDQCEYLCQNGLYDYPNQVNGDDDAANNANNNNNGNNNNNNNNGNDDDDYCYYTCMADNNMSYCDNDNNGNGDQNMDELIECRPLGGDDNNRNNNNNYYNQNNNYQVYYVGAYCTSSGVFLGTFTDSSCSKPAPKGTYEKYTGYSLPTQNLVGTDCISCKNVQNDNNNNNGNNNNNNNQNGNNNNQNYDWYGDEEVFDVCEKLYEDAGKCETNLDIQYKNTASCELMHGTLKRLDAAFHNKGNAAKGLAWFFGLSCVLLGAYVVWIHTKVLNRQQVNLLPSLNANHA